MTPPPTPLSRRRMLGYTAGFGSAAIAAFSARSMFATAATSGAPATATTTGIASTVPADTLATGTPATTVFTAADFDGLGICRVLPELTQGPFPTIDQIERRDITEGMNGLPLRVGVLVVDDTCTPIPGANVEIWHCDIDGDYSSYADGYTSDDAGPGTTFLRGAQVANDDGIVEFITLWPGWYRGRAVHIHAKVHLDDTTVLTTQFLFDDALNTEVMATEPYAAYGPPDTTNATDGVTRGTGADDGLLFTVRDDSELGGRRALIVVGVDPDAESTAGGGGNGGPDFGGPGNGGPDNGGPGNGGPGAGRPGGPPPGAPTTTG